MSKIHGGDTKPEIIVRKYLHNKGFRYRLHVKTLPGKPDIVLPKYKTVIFVNGCFWHGHQDCPYFVVPDTNQSFWLEKIAETKTRDINSREKLEEMGWKVLIVWECEIRRQKDRLQSLNGLDNEIKSIPGQQSQVG